LHDMMLPAKSSTPMSPDGRAMIAIWQTPGLNAIATRRRSQSA
jgi:hypothetical protein